MLTIGQVYASGWVGIGRTTPLANLHLRQPSDTDGGAEGVLFAAFTTQNAWKLYHSGTNFSFAEWEYDSGSYITNRRAYVQTGTGAWMQDSDRAKKKGHRVPW